MRENRTHDKNSSRRPSDGNRKRRGYWANVNRQLESNSSTRLRHTFRRPPSQPPFAYAKWSTGYTRVIVPISATLAGSTLLLAIITAYVKWYLG